MDKAWWNNFMKSTDNMEQTMVFPQIIDKEKELNWYRMSCMYVIKLIALEKREKPRFRIWIDKELREDYVQKVYDNPPQDGNDNLEKWSKRVFGDQKFGMIINDVEAFYDPLNRKLAQNFSPLIDKIGLPTGGIVMGIFLGNYGYTPLGIHLDSPEEKIFHFHLGPGKKEMYEWEKNTYEDLNGGILGYQEIEKVIDHSIKHSFEQGDLFYMPQKKYHIGYSGELSMDLAVGFNNEPKNRVTKKVFEFRNDLIKQNKDEELSAEYFNSEDSFSEVYEKLKPIFEIDDTYENLTVKEFFGELISDYQLCLAANQGFYTKQLNDEDDVTPDMLADKSVVISKPFKIFYKVISNENINVFTRGYKFSIWYHPALPKIIDDLNTGKTFKAIELIQPLLDEWSEEVGFYFLSLLINYNGISITE